jgi:hypothetical protein
MILRIVLQKMRPFSKHAQITSIKINLVKLLGLVPTIPKFFVS